LSDFLDEDEEDHEEDDLGMAWRVTFITSPEAAAGEKAMYLSFRVYLGPVILTDSILYRVRHH
jgi:hypothetical protein